MIIHGDAKTISTALIKARSAMDVTVVKDASGNYGKFTSLAAIVEATAPHFAQHGLAVVQEASADDVGLVVETWLVHESGAMMQFTPLTMPLTDRRPQAVGSAITYARRYALAAICGIAPQDDDGQAAQDAQARKNAPQAATSRAAGNHTTSTPNGSQSDATPATSEDEVFDAPQKPRATKAQLKDFEALGLQYYAEEWPEPTVKLCEGASRGATKDPGELLETEMAVLLAGLKKRIAKLAAAQEQVAA